MNRIPVRYALAPDRPTDIPLPSYAHEGDAGLDLVAISSHYLAPGVRALVRTGLVLEIPSGYEGQVRPRSGLAIREGVVAVLGTIDAGYRGEIQVTLINYGAQPFEVKPGMRIAQLVIAPVVRADLMPVELDALTSTTRGAGGFGSTGR